MKCECILQSGKNAGKKCGKNAKEGTAACGIHAKVCHKKAKKSPAKKAGPARKAAPRRELSSSPVRGPNLDRQIILLINNLLVDSFPKKVTFAEIREHVTKKKGAVVLAPYKEHILQMRKNLAAADEKCEGFMREAGKIMPRAGLIA